MISIGGNGDKINYHLYVTVVLNPKKKMRFLKFSFAEIYGDKMANEMNNLVRGTLDKLYDYYSYVNLPNVQVLSGSKTTYIEGDAIGCTNPYAMV